MTAIDRKAALETAMRQLGYSTEHASDGHYFKDERSRDFEKGWHAARSANPDGTVRTVNIMRALPAVEDEYTAAAVALAEAWAEYVNATSIAPRDMAAIQVMEKCGTAKYHAGNRFLAARAAKEGR